MAIATPLTPEFRPDVPRLAARTGQLLASGCDGVALFGTTGEGAEFAVADRIAALDELIASGVEPERIVVSVGALAIPDIVELSGHATARGVAGVLLMPPGIYRNGISDDGAFRFFATVVDRVARPDLRLYLYHFPDICGVRVTPNVIRRLDERYPGIIAGVKDSGGDLAFTQDLVRRFSHLSIFTGSETHLPDLVGTGLRGTVCGLANIMPRMIRALLDQPTAFDRRAMLPHLLRGDAILSRRPFIPSAKAVLADLLGDPAWRRVIPPLPEIAPLERQRLLADYWSWDAGLPVAWQSLPHPVQAGNVVDLRRA